MITAAAARSANNNAKPAGGDTEMQSLSATFAHSPTNAALSPPSAAGDGNPDSPGGNFALDTLAERTWGDILFPPLGVNVSFWRQGPVDVVSWWLTLACFVAPMCKNPADLDGSQTRDIVVRCIEIGLAVGFMIEWVLRATCIGLGEGTARHFRWLDFIFSAACAIFHILFFAGVGSFNIELLTARSIRLFRPFVRVTTMPAVRIFLTSMTRSVIRGTSVIVLFIFFLAWFGAAGGYEFGGALRARCVSDAYYENDTNISEFVTTHSLKQTDFVCGSAFFQFMKVYYGNTTGYATLMALNYSDTFANTVSCNAAQTCIYHKPESGVPVYGGFHCPFAYRCLLVGDNPYHNVIGFDNFFQSCLTLFVSNTFQIWYELEGWIADTGDPGAHHFFLTLILIGGLMIPNVTTVILSIEFDASMAEEKRSIVEQMSGVTASRAALQNVVRTMTQTSKKGRKRTVQPKSAKMAAAAGGAEADGRRSPEQAGVDGLDPVSAAAAQLIFGSGSGKASRRKKEGSKKGEQPSLLDWTDQKSWQEADAANPVEGPRGGAGLLILEEEMRSMDGNESTLLADFKPPPPRLTVQQFLKQRVVKTKLFTLITGCIVLMNCIVMSLENNFISDEERANFFILNAFFTAFYIIEYLMRAAADGLRGLKKVSLIMDLIIVILSIIDLATSELRVPGVRAFRVVRLVKLLKFFPSLYEWIILIAVAIQSSPVLLVVMMVIQVSFACICMPLLGGRFCGLNLDSDIHLVSSWTPEDLALFSEYQLKNRTLGLDSSGECMGRPRATFDTLGDAIVSAYQIATADDWDLILYDAMRARGWWIALLFLVYFYTITYLILNQIIAVLLTANKQQEDLSVVAGDAGKSEEALKKLEEAEARQRKAETEKREAEQKALEEAQLTGIGDEDEEGETADDDDEDEEEAAAADENGEKKDAGAGAGSSGSATKNSNKSKKSNSKNSKKKSGGGKRKGGKDQRMCLSRIVDCYFTVSDRSREWARKICQNHRFLLFMSLVIIVGSLSMAFESPQLAPDSTTTLFLYDLDIWITSLYVLELVLNVHAYGLIRRPTAYLQRDAWNVMDAFLVIVSVIGLFSSSVRGNIVIRVFRILRAVRPLRVVKRSPGMRLVLSSLIGSATQMVNVFVLSIIFFFTFSVIGMQFFSGFLRRCYVGSVLYEDLTLQNCTAINGTFLMRDGEPNFDTIGASFASMFLVATLENWAELMYRVMDSPALNSPSQRASNLFAAPFFMSSSFLLGFFIAGFFVSVLIDSYNRERRAASLSKSLLVLREQEAWLMSVKRIARVLPHDDRHIKYDDESWRARISAQLFEFRRIARLFVESNVFQNTVSVLVLGNFIMMALITYPGLAYTPYLEQLDDIFIFVWLAEAIIKIYALTWRAYNMSTWNRVDFLIMVVSLLSFIMSPFINPKTLSLVRVVRVFRLIRVVRRYTKVTTLLRMMARAAFALGHVLTFIGLIFFIFAVAGMNLFGRVAMDDRYSNFRSLGSSMFLLLRITLGGNWIDLFIECATQPPFCDPDIGGCGLVAPVPQIFFYSFLFISTFVLRNLFTAVMLDAFTSGGNLRTVNSDDSKKFYEVWRRFDEDETFMIHPFDTLPLLREIPLGDPAILGFSGEPRRTRVGREFKFLVALKMLSVHDPVPIEKFVDTLLNFAFLVPMPENAGLETVREGSAHIINPVVLQRWKDWGKELCKDIFGMFAGLYSVGKVACNKGTKVVRTVCADLAGIEYDKEEERRKEQADEQAEKDAEANRLKNAEDAAQRDGDEARSSASAKALARRSSFLDAAAGVLMDDESVHDLSEEDLYARAASYVMINTLITRKRQLIRDQIRLNERIALRKFDTLGLRGMKKAEAEEAKAKTSLAAATALATPSQQQQQHYQQQQPTPNLVRHGSSVFSQQGQPLVLSSSMNNGGGGNSGGVNSPSSPFTGPVISGYAPMSPFTSHHDEWSGSRPEALSTKELAARNAEMGLRVSEPFPVSSASISSPSSASPITKVVPRGGPNTMLGVASHNTVFAPPNPESTYFTSVCSYFATDERGVFSNSSNSNNVTPSSSPRTTTATAGGRSPHHAASRFFDDDDDGDNNDNDNDEARPVRALTVEEAPSLIADVLLLIDDLYNLGQQHLAADAASHTVELARCFVELEWWSEAMCDAVRSLPEDHSGVDVAVALLPTNAGLQALKGLHDTIMDSIGQMQEHYNTLALSDARLELDWYSDWYKSRAQPHEEYLARYPEMMQQKAESIFVGLLAKTLPTLQLVARLVPGLQQDQELDPSVILVAAENAIRRGAVWVSIACKDDSNPTSTNQLVAHCDPDVAPLFADAVRQAIAVAGSSGSSSPKWKDFVARVTSRAPSSTNIGNMVHHTVKRYLAGMRPIYAEYVEMHKSYTQSALATLEQLAAMRIVDLKENGALLSRQTHQVEQLRLCLQLLEQTYTDRGADGEPSAGLQFNDVATAQHPKKSLVVAALAHAMNSTASSSNNSISGALRTGRQRANRSPSEDQRSAAYDVAHAAELAHDCARKALHALMESIPGPAHVIEDKNDESFSDIVRHRLDHRHLHGGGGGSGGGLFHDEDISCKIFAAQSLTAVSRLAAAVASEPAPASRAASDDDGGATINAVRSADGEAPDAATTRLQSVVSAATGPEFRAKLKLLCDSGVTVYVMRAMPHVAEQHMQGVAQMRDVGISSGAAPQHTVSPPKRLWLRLARTMDHFELRQPIVNAVGFSAAADSSSNVVARIPLSSLTRIDGDTIGAAQSFGASAASAWPALATALQNARVMRFVVDTRRFAQRKRGSSRTGGGTNSPEQQQQQADDASPSSPTSGAAAPISLMMPFGAGHDSVPHGHERSIVFALPGSVVFGEWLGLLRDVVRHRKLLPVLFASRAEELRQEAREEDKLFRWKSAVRTIGAANKIQIAVSGGGGAAGGGYDPFVSPGRRSSSTESEKAAAAAMALWASGGGGSPSSAAASRRGGGGGGGAPDDQQQQQIESPTGATTGVRRPLFAIAPPATAAAATQPTMMSNFVAFPSANYVTFASSTSPTRSQQQNDKWKPSAQAVNFDDI